MEFILSTWSTINFKYWVSLTIVKPWMNRIRSSGGSRVAATCNMEHFVIIVNGWKLLSIITKLSIMDVAAALGPSLRSLGLFHHYTLLRDICVTLLHFLILLQILVTNALMDKRNQVFLILQIYLFDASKLNFPRG